MDARPGEETLDISGPSSLSHLGPPASSCHCLSRVQTIVGKQGRNRAVHPTSRWVDVGHWDRSERLQKKRPATKQHHWIPGPKFSLDDSRIAGQDNVTIISPTSDHSGPACIGPGSELPASVAVPCGRKRRGPDRPLSANSPHGRPITKETQDKQSSLPVQHRHPLHPSRPSSLNHCRQRGRLSPNGTWGHSHHLIHCTPHYQRRPLPQPSVPRHRKEPRQPQAVAVAAQPRSGTNRLSRHRSRSLSQTEAKHAPSLPTTPVALNRT